MKQDVTSTDRVGRDLVKRDWRKPLRAGTVASLATVAAFSFEEIFWRQLNRSAEADILVVMILAATVVTGALAVGLRMFVADYPALTSALTPSAVIIADRVVRAVEHRSATPNSLEHYSAVVSLPLGLAFAWTVARLLVRPYALRILLASSAAFIPVAARWPTELMRAAARGESRRPDIILLVMDTTRRDHLSVYGYPLSTSPALERLGTESAVYEDAWSVAPWTPSSHASLFTGRLPGEHGVDGAAFSPFPAGIKTLQETLRTDGYRTAGFVANLTLTAPGWGRAFNHYSTGWYAGQHSLITFLNARLGLAEVSGKSQSHRVLARARRWWISQAGRPRFLFVNLIDPHRPYRPPPDYENRFLGDIPRTEAEAVEEDPDEYILGRPLNERERRSLNALYDGEIAAMDAEIGGFVTWLRGRGDLDNAILVITADHGERLGERGLVGHEAPAERSMDQYLLRVPLLVRYPRVVAPGRVASRVRLDGLAGQVLRLAGVAAPAALEPRPWGSPGSSDIVAQFKSPTRTVNRLVAEKPGLNPNGLLGDWSLAADGRYACSCPAAGPVSACVVVDMTGDPDWRHNLIGTMPEGTARLCEVARSLPRFEATHRNAASPEFLERLRSLGYER